MPILFPSRFTSSWAASRQEPRLAWEKSTQVPMIVCTALYLASYSIPIMWPDLPPQWQQVCGATQLTTWVLFGVDVVIRVVLGRATPACLRDVWFDMALLLLPLLRPLRALRAVFVLRALSVRGDTFNRLKAVQAVVWVTGLIVFLGSVAVYDAERLEPDASIMSFGDALWWAVITVSTVGYGDYYPISTEGKFIAFGLTITSIGLLGVITAAFASWFMERLSDTDATLQATSEHVDQLLEELRLVRQEVAELREQQVVPGTHDGCPRER